MFGSPCAVSRQISPNVALADLCLAAFPANFCPRGGASHLPMGLTRPDFGGCFVSPVNFVNLVFHATLVVAVVLRAFLL